MITVYYSRELIYVNTRSHELQLDHMNLPEPAYHVYDPWYQGNHQTLLALDQSTCQTPTLPNLKLLAIVYY